VDSTTTRKLRAALAAVTILAVCAAAVPGALGAGYPRPRGATPYRSSLVPVYERCPRPGHPGNTTHGAPLAYNACEPPELISGTLTIGTPDANGAGANSEGAFTMSTIVCDSATPQDEADVKVDFSLTDVRLERDLSDYPASWS
jgi:hypothetical protein